MHGVSVPGFFYGYLTVFFNVWVISYASNVQPIPSVFCSSTRIIQQRNQTMAIIRSSCCMTWKESLVAHRWVSDLVVQG